MIERRADVSWGWGQGLISRAEGVLAVGSGEGGTRFRSRAGRRRDGSRRESLQPSGAGAPSGQATLQSMARSGFCQRTGFASNALRDPMQAAQPQSDLVQSQLEAAQACGASGAAAMGKWGRRAASTGAGGRPCKYVFLRRSRCRDGDWRRHGLLRGCVARALEMMEHVVLGRSLQMPVADGTATGLVQLANPKVELPIE